MKLPNDTGFENHELSIEELDAIAAGGLWGWIKHEASAVVHFLGSEYAKAENALNSVLGGGRINITIHKQN
jgi:hypothetical protein